MGLGIFFFLLNVTDFSESKQPVPWIYCALSGVLPKPGVSLQSIFISAPAESAALQPLWGDGMTAEFLVGYRCSFLFYPKAYEPLLAIQGN